MPVFTPEENRRIVKSLSSSVIATRFMTLKYLSDIALNTPSEFERLELEDQVALEEIMRLIHDLESGRDESLQREAKVCLGIIKSKLSPKYSRSFLRCGNCHKILCHGWINCPYCGNQVNYASGNKCPDCDMNLESSWIFCVRCGKKIREISNILLCPQCNKETQPIWVMCPHCGKMLK
jgi:hypothetical protein